MYLWQDCSHSCLFPLHRVTADLPKIPSRACYMHVLRLVGVGWYFGLPSWGDSGIAGGTVTHVGVPVSRIQVITNLNQNVCILWPRDRIVGSVCTIDESRLNA
ncbi:unnamed protein product [Ixodes pacificus]